MNDGGMLVDRPAADDPLLQPGEQDQHREREDERVEAELHDHEAVEEARQPRRSPSTTRMPKAGFQCVPSPWPSFGTISHAPIIGARP